MLDRDVRAFEQRMRTVFRPTPEIDLLLTLPGVGFTLAVVMALEVGDVTRFASSEKFAAYAGTTRGSMPAGARSGSAGSNHSLKWAFVETATVICRHRRRHPARHVSHLYERLARRKGHPQAIGAVARHLPTPPIGC